MEAKDNFRFVDGCDFGVHRDENHLMVEWIGPERVVFSFSQRGKAIMAHVATDKRGLRYLKPAIHDFCRWAFWAMPWAKTIMAVIEKPSIERLVKKCGFSYLISHNQYRIYAKEREEIQWAA